MRWKYFPVVVTIPAESVSLISSTYLTNHGHVVSILNRLNLLLKYNLTLYNSEGRMTELHTKQN